MSNTNRRVFAHAPLRSATSMALKNPVSYVARDWYEKISNSSLLIFDLVSVALFTVIGSLLILTSSSVLGMGRYQLSLNQIMFWKAAYRFGFVALATTFAAIGLWLGQRFKLVEQFDLMTPVKLLSIAMLAWGAYFLYFDPVAGFVPMSGLTLISLMLLFRLELKEAMYMGGYLALCGLPVFLIM